MTTTNINVERLSTGSLIWVRDGFNAAAEVLDIEFDYDQYIITYGTDDCRSTTRVNAGETVEAFNHQTFLRSLDEVGVEEWEALNRQDATQDAPVNLLTAVRAMRAEPAAANISLNTITEFMCAVVASSSSLDSVREGSDQLEAAE